MVHIALVDDEATQTSYVEGLISRYGEEHSASLKVSKFHNVVNFLESYSADYDIIFMDVKMPLLNGIEAARALRKKDQSVILFFLTSMEQYALAGYEVEAMDYIIKPVSYYDFAHFAALLHCEVYMATGFVDEGCPPSNIIAAYNNIPAGTKKHIYTNPRTGHGGETRNLPAITRIEQLLDPVDRARGAAPAAEAAVSPAEVEKLPGGWYFKPGALKGASRPEVYDYQCPPRLCTLLTRPSFKQSSIRTVLPLAAAPKAPLCLAIEGLDDDKSGASLLKVEVNGKELFAGANTFKESVWSRMSFMIPAEYLKAGNNEIRISDVTPDTPSRSACAATPEEAKRDSQWGWIQISEMIVTDPAGDFAAFADGGKNARWRQSNAGLEGVPGKIAAGGGKVVFTAGEAPRLVLSFFRTPRDPKIAVPEGASVRVSIEAAGKGKAQFALNTYLPYPRTAEKTQKIDRSGYLPGGHYNTYKSPEFELAATSKLITHTFRFGRPVGMVHPDIMLVGPGSMTVTDFRLEVLPSAGRK